MISPNTDSQMPYGAAIAKSSQPPMLPPLSLPPPPTGGAPAAAGPALGMPPGAPAMPPQPGAPPQAPSAPMAPQPPPWTVLPQDDGSSIYALPPLTPGGKPVIIGVNPPPKLPRALQPKKPAAQ